MDQSPSLVWVWPRTERPVRQYVALGVILVVAATYQAMVARDICRTISHPETVYEFPFALNPATAIITDPLGGPKTGLRKGDLLVAIDGKPYVGTYVWDEALAQPRSSSVLTVMVRSPAGTGFSGEKTLRIPLTNYQAGGDNARPVVIFRLVTYILMPGFCLILGFWVAAVRPRDRLAWLLLGLMLGFSQLLGVSTGAWGPGIRDAARFYHMLAGDSWSLAMLIFGLYFPEPFPDQDRSLWRILKWTMIVLIVAVTLPQVILKTIESENYAAVQGLSVRLAPLDAVELVLDIAAVSVFFISIFMKGSMAVSRDAKRRLRLLYFGATVSLAPVFIAVMVGM